jgi:hypothetical protein
MLRRGLQLVVFLALTGLGSPAFATTWTVIPDGSGDATTIQGGVDLASDGDIVLVAASTYSDVSTVNIGGTPTSVCVAIDKNIQLLSESGPATTIISNPDVDIAVYVHDVGPGTTISGFTIETAFDGYACLDAAPASPAVGSHAGILCVSAPAVISGNQLANHDSAIVLDASSAMVTGNTIKDSFIGVYCVAGSNAEVTNNVIHGCAGLIFCQNSALNVTGNDLYDACTGIYTLGGAPLVVSENLIHDLRNGVDARGVFTIENNRFFIMLGTGSAVYLSGASATGAVRGNVFYHVGLAMHLRVGPGVTIEANTFDGSLEAFYCDGASPVIRRNIVLHSDVGLGCWAGAAPTFECNDMFDVNHPVDGQCSDPTGMNGNIAVDPQFCGVADSGNYYLQADSPCAPGNHPDGTACDVIGAFGVGCGAVPVKTATWGAVKSLYRD